MLFKKVGWGCVTGVGNVASRFRTVKDSLYYSLSSKRKLLQGYSDQCGNLGWYRDTQTSVELWDGIPRQVCMFENGVVKSDTPLY